MSNNLYSIDDIYKKNKSERVRIRDTITLKDYVCLHKLDRLRIIAIDMTSISEIELLITCKKYTCLSCEKEIKLYNEMTYHSFRREVLCSLVTQEN